MDSTKSGKFRMLAGSSGRVKSLEKTARRRDGSRFLQIIECLVGDSASYDLSSQGGGDKPTTSMS